MPLYAVPRCYFTSAVYLPPISVSYRTLLEVTPFHHCTATLRVPVPLDPAPSRTPGACDCTPGVIGLVSDGCFVRVGRRGVQSGHLARCSSCGDVERQPAVGRRRVPPQIRSDQLRSDQIKSDQLRSVVFVANPTLSDADRQREVQNAGGGLPGRAGRRCLANTAVLHHFVPC